MPEGSGREGGVRVTSEVGGLRRALVHEPGREVDLMVPSMMRELLFDDILLGERAREEHALFRRVLNRLGVETFEALDLLGEALSDAAGREWVEARVLPHLLPEFRDRIASMDAVALAEALVGGIRRHPVDPACFRETLYGVRPLPNWCFQRDTQVIVGSRVLFSSMASPARYREAVLSEAIFRFHPRFSRVPVLSHVSPELSFTGEPGFPGKRGQRPEVTLEGGDVLVLSDEVLVVGCSERTSKAGVESLVRSLSRTGAGEDGAGPEVLLRVDLPRRRAYMHLDTLFTPISGDACLVFPPVILPGHPDVAETWEYDLRAPETEPVPRGDLLTALRRLGLDFDPVPCGGSDPMEQRREQWTDGANALAVAPGIVVLYDRNVRTAEELARRGYAVMEAEELLSSPAGSSQGRGALDRACVLIPSGELSRARGGPRCLTHPLERDPVPGDPP